MQRGNGAGLEKICHHIRRAAAARQHTPWPETEATAERATRQSGAHFSFWVAALLRLAGAWRPPAGPLQETAMRPSKRGASRFVARSMAVWGRATTSVRCAGWFPSRTALDRPPDVRIGRAVCTGTAPADRSLPPPRCVAVRTLRLPPPQAAEDRRVLPCPLARLQMPRVRHGSWRGSSRRRGPGEGVHWGHGDPAGTLVCAPLRGGVAFGRLAGAEPTLSR
jgi:hypothetical protein